MTNKIEQKSINIDGVCLAYNDGGEGHPVILMHGWGCNRSTLASIERVALESNRVINVDFPGFGDSTEPDSVWGVEKYTQLIEHLCEIEKIKSPILLGHSFGGRVAINFASRNSVEKLILVDAAGVKPRRSFNYYRKVYTFKSIKFLLNTFLGKDKARPIIDRYRSSKGSSDYNVASDRMKQILSRVVNEDLCHLMPQISAPTLLVWGEDDSATPLSDAKKMERLIPGAALVSFSGCGHYSFLDNPIQFAAVLRSFLQS